jgi:hypothetical protein
VDWQLLDWQDDARDLVWNRDAIAAKSDTFPRFMKKLILFL